MATATEPKKWNVPLGETADINGIPDEFNASEPSVSMKQLFSPLYQLPLSAGGVAPDRRDTNALFKILGDHVWYAQHGGVSSYSENFDYDVGAVVLFNGKTYIAIAANGVSTSVKAPSDDSAWAQLSSLKDIQDLGFVNVSGTQTITGAKDFTGGITVNGQPINVVPTGTIIPFAGATIPAGYLLCNGVAVSRTSYAALFGVISTLYGTGDGTTTFNLPDLRDRFLEGAGTNALAAYLEAGLPNITGTFGGSLISFWLRSNWITNGGTVDDANGYYTMSIGALTSLANNADNTARRTVATTIDNTAVTPNGITIDASHSSVVYSKSATVQPRALNIQYLIKY